MINFFGLRDNLTEYLDLLKNCDSDGSQESKVIFYSPCLISLRIKQQYAFLAQVWDLTHEMIFTHQEKIAKGRGIIKEVNESFKAVNLEDTTKQLVQVLTIILLDIKALSFHAPMGTYGKDRDNDNIIRCGSERAQQYTTLWYYSSVDPKKLCRNNFVFFAAVTSSNYSFFFTHGNCICFAHMLPVQKNSCCTI